MLSKTFLRQKLTYSSSIIYNALLKNGYQNFYLEILEYCEAINTVKREQYYINLVNPEYNILRVAGSSLGFKHSLKTKAKMSESGKKRITMVEQRAKLFQHLKSVRAYVGFKAKRLAILKIYLAKPEIKELLSQFNASLKIRAQQSERFNNLNKDLEFKAKRNTALKAHNFSKENKEHLSRLNSNPEIQARRLEHLKNLNDDSELKGKRLDRIREVQAHQVIVLDTQSNKTSSYASIREAAKGIEVSPQTISQAFKRQGESSI